MRSSFLLVIISLLAACAAPEPPRGLLGAYRLDNGEIVSISRSVDGTLRYRVYESGHSGRLFPDADTSFVSGAGFSGRDPIELTVEFEAGAGGIAQSILWQPVGQTPQQATRIGQERFLRFENDGAEFHARLQLPESSPPYPAVVLVHGSGDSPGTEWFYNSDFLVANGIAALTYDKRGSGRSSGKFTYNFDQLARDAVAAVQALAEEPEIDPGRIGLSGYSQGSWVAPLASTLTDDISYVIVNYGMIESPAQEARLEMRQLLIDANVSDAELADADQLIDAAVNLVANEFDSGWTEFAEAKARYGDAAWMVHLKGTPIDRLVSYPKFLVNALSGFLLPDGLQWNYDSTELLQATSTPMVWLLAAEDRSAPNRQTIATLKSLEQRGRPVKLIVFPEADHGMLTYREADGERVYTGYAPGYFQAEVEAAQRLSN